MWVKVVSIKGGGIRLEYAGLARGEDPALEAAVTVIAQKHADQLSLRLKP